MFSSSIGIRELLIQLLLSISTKYMLFGTFCNRANEVFRIKHCKAMVNYLDSSCNHIMNKKRYFKMRNLFQRVLAVFFDKDKCNGIPLREVMLKRIFSKYIKIRESYVQQSFRLHHN